MIPKRTLLPDIDPARCTGCGRCVAACGPHVLSLEPRGWVKSSVLHDPTACTGCGACEAVCPFSVIAMVEGAAVQLSLADECAGSLVDSR